MRKLFFVRAVCALLLLCFVFSPAQAAEIPYSLTIEGVSEKDLRDDLEQKSLLIKLADQKPEGLSALDRRVKNDARAFRDVLQEHGYFGASINYDIADKDGKKAVIFKIERGERYTIKAFNIEGFDDIDTSVKMPELPHGEPALPVTILDSEQALLNTLMQKGHPFPEINGRRLFIHHDSKSVTVELFLAPGAKAVFGETSIEGLQRLEAPFVERRIVWQKGEPFDITKIAATRRKLTRSGVLSRADITYDDIGPDGVLPVAITVKERKHRSVGAGVAYSTTHELVGNVFWEHRNVLGQAERIKIKAEGGTATYALGADMAKPDLWGNEELSWQGAVDIRQEDLEAFDKDTASFSTTLNYEYSETSAISGGVAIEHSRIKEEGLNEEAFTLMSLPLTYRYDATDDFLNPRTGMRFNLGVTPYQVLNGQDSFVKTHASLSHYLPAGEKFVWANRARAAAIHGQTREDIPADKRLYAGGSGSVRGYGYQLLGPLNENNKPTGGRAAFEIGTEGRYKFTETIEGVAFVEGGRVSQDVEFGNDAETLWGAGAGVRYHTAIGPLRFDLAVPLDQREPDDAYQFYISIGQAF